MAHLEHKAAPVAPVPEDRMQRAFNLFDADGDGKISQSQLKEVLRTLGLSTDKDRTMSDDELRGLIGGNVDGMFTARGGAIDFSQFKELMVCRAASRRRRRAASPRAPP